MWAPKFLFDKLMHTYELFVSIHRQDVEFNLNNVLQAKQSELNFLMKVKDEEIAFLKDQVQSYSKLVDHERARAEAAIDRLLVREAHVPPVANADLAKSIGEQDTLAAEAARRKEKELETIIAMVNGVGEDAGEESPTEKLVEIGGFKVDDKPSSVPRPKKTVKEAAT